MKKTYDEIDRLIGIISEENNEISRYAENSRAALSSAVIVDYLKSLKDNVDDLYNGTKDRIDELENDVVKLNDNIKKLNDTIDDMNFYQ